MYHKPSPRTSTSSTNTSNSSQVGYTPRGPSDVPATVRALLLGTKALQTALAQWAAGQVSETHVSDVYVQIGTDFNNTIQAFAYHRIDLREIHSVPGELRTVLEQCLAEDPSPEVLAQFMPEVKAILVKLLRGLQARREAWLVTRAGGGAPYDYR
ncbi:hypothetical protein B0H15DRAFT_922023 [Mycena belliarum]|uniref:Aip3p/Bud6 N-terminal domain-containing protein n=1 Tax=Mycena belliarum TaxID=1033014 RepID=A0AAD6XQS1_9AGAR|nr:hypothetical protein B0H15DRAFT_922023 [Mycena belliae]